MLAPNVDASFRHLAAAFAGPGPEPAGGAAGVAAIAMGVGLGLKVIAISRLGRAADPLRESLEAMLDRVLPAFAEDCAAFAGVLEALSLPRDDAGRAERVRAAWREATAAPVAVAVCARGAEAVLARCLEAVKTSVRGDLDAAIELVRAGQRIAEGNARDNARHLDAATAAELLAPLAAEPGPGAPDALT